MNEPADESRAVVGPFYERLVDGDPRGRPGPHPLLGRQHLLDRVRLLRRAAGERRLHAARLRARRARPRRRVPRARVGGGEVPRALGVRAQTGTPIYVGEFAPIYTGDEAVDARAPPDPRRPARRSTARYDAGFATWMYKDLGRQGLVYGAAGLALRRAGRRLRRQEERGSASTSGAAPAARTPRSPSRSRSWSSARRRTSTPTRGAAFDWVRTLVLNITLAQPLAGSTPSCSAASARTS